MVNIVGGMRKLLKNGKAGRILSEVEISDGVILPLQDYSTPTGRYWGKISKTLERGCAARTFKKNDGNLGEDSEIISAKMIISVTWLHLLDPVYWIADLQVPICHYSLMKNSLRRFVLLLRTALRATLRSTKAEGHEKENRVPLLKDSLEKPYPELEGNIVKNSKN
ncbi:hypothetical protein Tco_0888776 [Tanacetum coccineum]